MTHAEPIRIISLLPSATEILFAVGAGDNVVGTTHECDYPLAARALPNCTANLLPSGLTAKEIDTAVTKSLRGDPHTIYALKEDVVRVLRPTTIVTQSLCAVCAVPQKMVDAVACTLPVGCTVVAADPHTLEDLFDAIGIIGRAVNRLDAAVALVVSLKRRMRAVSQASGAACDLAGGSQPSVAVLEWPDPVFAPGHWVPDQIAAAAGNCVFGTSGVPSRRVSWKDVHRIRADIIVCAFCGYNLAENQREVDLLQNNNDWSEFSAGKAVYATNASAYFSRPGNRLVDGTELLAFIFYRVEQYRPQSGCASLLTKTGWIDLSVV